MYGNRGAGGDALGWDSLKGTSNRHLLKHILGEKIRHPGEWCSLRFQFCNRKNSKNRQVTFATSAVELDSESGGTTGAVSSSTHGQDNLFYHGRASEIFLSFVLSLFLENQVAIFGLVRTVISERGIVYFCR